MDCLGLLCTSLIIYMHAHTHTKRECVHLFYSLCQQGNFGLAQTLSQAGKRECIYPKQDDISSLLCCFGLGLRVSCISFIIHTFACTDTYKNRYTRY